MIVTNNLQYVNPTIPRFIIEDNLDNMERNVESYAQITYNQVCCVERYY